MEGKLGYSFLGVGRKLVIFIFIASALWYLIWRTGTFNANNPGLSLLVYAAEWYAFIVALLHIFSSWKLTVRKPPAVPDGLQVAVFIPTINEPICVVRRTVLAAVNMDYPHETWLLDDGNRAEMAALADELGCHYLARTENTHAKAGNLNNGLAHTKADFIAIFDADHCPNKNFLLHTLGYFNKPSVAFVQTPQDFYNLDSYQHHLNKKKRMVWNEQTLFFRLIQRGKDAWNAAIFCGSCAVIRRSALDEINGFATGTVTEDIHTSLRLHKKGYESVYHAESLAFGLAPTSHRSFLIQRIRWGQGAMQVWRKEGVLFSRNLTFAQRLSYMASITVFFEGWQRGFFYFLPAFVVMTGLMPVNTIGSEFLQHFIPYFVFSIWAYVEVSRGYGWPFTSEQYTMARYGAFIKSTFGIFMRNLKFHVTPKAVRDLSGDKLYYLPQYAVFIVNVSTILLVFLFMLTPLNSDLPSSVLYASLIWATLNCIIAAAVLKLFAPAPKQKRCDYRHPVPLPVRIEIGNSSTYSAVDCLSPNGMRLLFDATTDIENEKTAQGEIYLPSGPLPFKARIVRAEQHSLFNYDKDIQEPDIRQPQVLGCEFVLMSVDDQNRLNLFLYGTDVQVKVNNFQERKTTPVEWLQNYIYRHKQTWGDMPSQWLPVAYNAATPDGQASIGLISADQRAALLPFGSQGMGGPIELQPLSHIDDYPLYAKFSRERRIEGADSSLYLYRLDKLN